LCSFDKVTPFLVALFYGDAKPILDSYLEEFIVELKDLCANGITVHGKNYGVHIQNFVCDAPARAFLKCTKFLIMDVNDVPQRVDGTVEFFLMT